MARYYLDNGKLKKKKKKPTYTVNSSGKVTKNNDVAPVDPKQARITDTSKTKKDGRTWFQKSGVFDDGYQFGDITKAILGTTTDTAEHLTSGGLNIGETMLDALASVSHGAMLSQKAQSGQYLTQKDFDLAEEMKKENEKFIKKDLYDAEKIAKKIITNPVEKVSGIDVETTSVLGEKSDALVESAGQLGVTALMSPVVPWYLTSGLTSFGGEMENALNQGAEYEEALGSSLITAGAEVLSEKISGGISFGGKTLDKALGEKLSKTIASKTLNKITSMKGTKLLGDMLGEGGEEVFSSVMSRLGSALYKEESLDELLASEEAFDEYLESFIGGSVLGGVASAVQSKNRLTDNESKVLEAEIERRKKEYTDSGETLTEEKSKEIRKEVIKDMAEGNLDLDFIERTLDEESYKGYDELVKESEEFEELRNTKSGDLTDVQADRLKELKAKNEANPYSKMLEESKQKISQDIFNSIEKDTRLRESYYEDSRRRQDYKADLTKYDSKQAETIKRAMDSGILNNSRKTHAFVDMVAKVSADKGVSFDFLNNKRLRESGFAIEGKRINGFKKGNTITVNMESRNNLNTVVGHEITHVLEGDAELYSALADGVKAFGEAKGIYQEMYDTAFENYKNVYKDMSEEEYAKAIEKEVTADLVGEYIFSDVDFVRSLSTKNKNVFQKVYDEIKYFLKTVTAGSDAEKQLLKAKKIFEEVYRESSAIDNADADADVQFSIRKEAPPKETGIAYKVFYVKDGKLYPPMVANPDGADTPMGVWLNADVGTSAPPSKTGRPQVKAGGKGTQGGSGSLAFRPGWHLGDLPRASQFDRVNPETGKKELFPENFVWAEVEYAKDVDYQEEAMSYGYTDNGKFRHAYAGLPKLPENGYYRYRTNPKPDTVPWVITGAMKVNRLLSDAEVNAILEENGVSPVHRQGGDVELEKFGFNNDGTVQYSLTDSNGKELSKEQQEYFKDSKVRDENGNLQVVYHGSPNDFNEFSLKYLGTNGTAEGYGFYFTNHKDIAENYASGTEATGFKGANGKLFEVYLDIKKPLSNEEVTMSRSDFKKFLLELNNQVDEDGEPLDMLSNYGDVSWEGLNKVLNYAMEIEYDGSDSDVNMVQSIINGTGQMETVFKVLRDVTGYDGIIIDDAKWGNNQSIYLAFHPEQIKNVDNTNPTDNPDIRYSLTDENKQIAPTRNGIYSKDVLLQSSETQAPLDNDIVDSNKMVQNDFAEDYAPLTEAQANVRDKKQVEEHYFTDEVQQETEEGYNGEYATHTKPTDPFYEKDIVEVGRDRKQKAYMYENPEVKPFFQQEARYMLGELDNSSKGEKFYNDQLYYDTNGEMGFFGTKRHTSEEIAYLLDTFGYTYKDIAKGLNAIIEDNGKENNAISKRIEFLLDERLRLGYTDFWFGDKIPPNQDYINLLNEKQINEYNDEAFGNWVQNLTPEEIEYFRKKDNPVPAPQEYAPLRSEPIARTTQKYEAIRPEPVKGEPRMVRVKDAPTKSNEPSQVAKVLTEEPKVEKKKNRFFAQAMELVADKGFVFENLAKKTKNRELEAKWNSTRYAEGMAQDFIGKGEGNVRALNDVQKEVEKAGLKQELSEYLYHLHNIDRMNLADRYDGMENKPVFGDSVTSDVSRSEVAKLEAKNPALKKYANEIYSINNHLRQMLVDGDVISQETADLWSEMYPHYVPIRRVGEHGFDINVPLDTRKTGINAPVKMATGGSSDIMPLFDTMAQRTLQTYRAVARNRFGVELKNTLGTVVGTETTDLDGVMEGMGSQDELLQKGKNGSKPTFTVFEGGEKVTFEIDETMYDALKPTSEALTYTNPVTNAISNFHRNVLTQYNPVFTMRNIIKDTQDVLINSQHPMKTYANYPKALAELTKKGKWYNEYVKNGGEQNTYFDKKTNTFVKDKSTFVKAMGMPLNAVTKANDFIERLPRLAEYIASREAGRSIEVSMLDSARVTTNFSAGGDLTKFLNRNGATFLNASVQGAMQQVRNIREAKMNGLKGWVQLATKGAIASIPIYLLNSMLWDDDEEYEELSDYVKQNYYVVAKFGDGNFVRIPKGRTLSVIQNAFDQTMNALTGDDEVDLASFTQLAITNLAPNNPFEDNILAPIVQVANNETWYGGDLVPTRLQDLPNEEQYDESTDDLSRWLGEVTGQSPYKINYLLEQYSGAIGDVFLPMITPEAESGDDSMEGQLLAPLRDAFTTDSTLNNQNISDFYDTKDELTKVANSSGATDEDILSNKYINSVNSELGKLYGEKREVQNSNLPNSEKYNRVREIQKEINALAEESLNTYPNVQIDGDYATVGNKQYIYKDGSWQKLDKDQVKKQDEVTSSLGITPNEYWSNKKEYDFAYKDEGKYSIANAIGGYDAYEVYKDAISEFKADKDANGKTINGSAKEKKANYINSLDLDYGQKIILYRSLFDSKADKEAYNRDIVEYLDSREDLSYEEIVAILEELDFKVHDDGTVSW